jgi:hypothetical protein
MRASDVVVLLALSLALWSALAAVAALLTGSVRGALYVGAGLLAMTIAAGAVVGLLDRRRQGRR